MPGPTSVTSAFFKDENRRPSARAMDRDKEIRIAT